MEYTGVSGFGSECEEKKTAGDVVGALSDQDADDGMNLGGDVMDVDSQTKAEPISLAPGGLSSIFGPWRSSYDEGLCSSGKGAMEKIPDSGDYGADLSVLTLSEAPECQKATATDGFCGMNMPYLNDQGLDGTFASSFSLERSSIVSSAEPEVELLLANNRQTPSLLGENSTSSGRKGRFLLRHDLFSFRFPMSLPEAPPNIGFPFSPRLDSIPYEEIGTYENKFDQDKHGDSRSGPPKVAKRHYRTGTIPPDNVPLRVPVATGRVSGETPPAGLQFVEPFHSGFEGLVTTSLGTTVRVPQFGLGPLDMSRSGG